MGRKVRALAISASIAAAVLLVACAYGPGPQPAPPPAPTTTVQPYPASQVSYRVDAEVDIRYPTSAMNGRQAVAALAQTVDSLAAAGYKCLESKRQAFGGGTDPVQVAIEAPNSSTRRYVAACIGDCRHVKFRVVSSYYPPVVLPTFRAPFPVFDIRNAPVITRLPVNGVVFSRTEAIVPTEPSFVVLHLLSNHLTDYGPGCWRE